MSKAIKVTCKKLNTSDIWVWQQGTSLVNANVVSDTNHQTLITLGVQIYYSSSMKALLDACAARELVGTAKNLAWNNILEYNVHYYFPTDELFNNYKNMNYSYERWWTALPGWETSFSDNNITITFEEISNPDLTDYTLSPEHEFGPSTEIDI